ncbi:pseudouridine synthase [Pleomorphovibrio marinus]|uniref:pseudouridine synthase n=1 Tax=Pleomorphovibrio marinus TaxID=2164132 RepID=UPI000E0A8A54|nr:pseudouridine synthase [Pleomorphovibrio marinus]
MKKENNSQKGHPKKRKQQFSDQQNKGKRNTSSEKENESSKKVYLGRGKNQKPVYEYVADLPERSKPNKKKPYSPLKRGSAGYGTNEKPAYQEVLKEVKKNKDDDELRLNKYIANSGVCSRREADVLIAKGDITVNGEVITSLGYKVKRKDRVLYKSKVINPEKPVYLLLNKPKDYITTTDDPFERRTVMQLIEGACEERVFPVGRLDRNTTGLLLFTNDGELTESLAHPSNRIKKIYQVTLDKPLANNDLEVILKGIQLEDGLAEVDDLQVLSKDRTILGLEIHSGKNRIVRRIFAAFDYEVVALDRVMYAGLTKKDIPRGRYRFLSVQEVINLKHLRRKK